MSFLDEQATGQIGIGEKANLSTLTRRKRKRKKGQAPTGAETYSLMPQTEFSNIVSSPTDIQQVGIGNLLQAQGSSAGEVPNVFDEYVSAAPRGTTLEAIYYQPPPDDDDPGDDDDLPSIEDDPYVPSPDAGEYGDPGMEGDPLGGPGWEAIDPETGQPYGFKGIAKWAGDRTKAIGETAGKIGRELEVAKNEAVIAAKNIARSGDQYGASSLGTSASDAYESYADQTIGTDSSGRSTAGGRGGMSPADVAAMNAALNTDTSPSVSEGDGGGQSVSAADVNAGTEAQGFDWNLASGGTVKAKNKNSFMSMKGK